jgi:hypothetical protein
VNFVINVSGDKPLCRVADVDLPVGKVMELHHIETRCDYQTGDQFVALVYKLTVGP